MIWLKLIYSVLFPTLLGLSALNIVLNKKEDLNLFERLALGFLGGLMLIVLEMLLFSKIGLRYSVEALSAPWLPLIIVGIYLGIKNKLFGFNLKLPKLTWLEILLIVLIVSKIIFVFVVTMIKPVVAWDAWANYSWRAHAYFVDGSVAIKDIFHTAHPLYNCLNQTWIFVCLNQWNDLLGKINYPLYYLSLLTVFYFSLRRTASRSITLLITYMLASLPFLIHHATTAYADFPMAAYYFAAFTLLLLWLRKQDYRYLLLGFFFVLATMLLKHEGLLYVAIYYLSFTASLFYHKIVNKEQTSMIHIITVALAALGATLLFYKLFFTHHEAIDLVTKIDLIRLPNILRVMTNDLFFRNNWNIFWFTLIILLLIKGKALAKNYNWVILMFILFNFGGFIAYYFLMEGAYSWLFYVTPAVRNTLQFVPTAALLLGNLANETL